MHLFILTIEHDGGAGWGLEGHLAWTVSQTEFISPYNFSLHIKNL